MKSDYVRLLIIVLTVFLTIGCGTFETRHYYSPQNTLNWKSLGGRSYQFECNGGEVEVTPIVLSSTEVSTQETPWIYVRFRSAKRIKNCDLSFVSLENIKSGIRIAPISAKTNVFNDNYFEKKTTDCYYYFDIREEKGSAYNLFISDKVLDCTIDPIPYKYGESTEWESVQFQ